MSPAAQILGKEAVAADPHGCSASMQRAPLRTDQGLQNMTGRLIVKYHIVFIPEKLIVPLDVLVLVIV